LKSVIVRILVISETRNRRRLPSGVTKVFAEVLG
jgi:hypothetical protein